MSATIMTKRGGTGMPAEVLISEVEWLLSFGTHPVTIATQLGMKLVSLHKVMERHERPDLLDALRLPRGEA